MIKEQGGSVLGPFHRIESPTQTCADAVEQVSSGEIWGLTARGGMAPSVKAYARALPIDKRGIEFITPIDPHPNGSPFEVRWYLGITDGVLRRERDDEEYAAIVADIENRQPALDNGS